MVGAWASRIRQQNGLVLTLKCFTISYWVQPGPDTTKPMHQITSQKADTLIICLIVCHCYISSLSSTLTQLHSSGFGATGCDPEPRLDQYRITVVQSAGLQAAPASLWFNTAHMLSSVQNAGLSNTYAVMTRESDITWKGTSTAQRKVLSLTF